MRQPGFSVNLAAISLACAQLPAIAQHQWSPPRPSQRAVDLNPEPTFRNGQASASIAAYAERQPLSVQAHEVLLLNSWNHRPFDIDLQARQLSATIKDDVAVFFTAQPPPESKGMVENVKDSIKALAMHLYASSLAGKDVHIIAPGTGAILLVSALNQLDSDLLAKEPVRRREALQHIHVMLLGDPGEAEDQVTKKGQRIFDNCFSPDLGSLSLIRRVDANKAPIEDSGANALLILRDYIPAVERRLLKESGIKDIAVKEFSQFAISPQDEIERTQDAIREMRKRLASEEQKAAIQQIELASLEAARDSIKTSIRQTLNNLNQLDYALNGIAEHQDQIDRQMRKIQKILDETSVTVHELEKSNAVNVKALKQLAATVRSIQTTLIRYALSYPRMPVNAEITMQVPKQPKNGMTDFDSDGIPDEVEESLLEKFRPYLALDRSTDRVPVSVRDFIEHSSLSDILQKGGMAAALEEANRRNDQIDLTTKDWRAKESNSIWYGRCAKPENTGLTRYGENLYLLQYYALYSYNSCPRAKDGTMLVDLVQPIVLGATCAVSGNPILSLFVSGIFDVSIVPKGHHEAEEIIGNHEGDVTCVDLVVDASDSKNPQIKFLTLHRHGHQTTIEGVGVILENGHPVVFAEAGTQELHPNPGDGGFSGLSKKAGYKIETGAVDEDTITHPFNGRYVLKNMAVWNLGEVQSDSSGYPIVSVDSQPVVFDSRPPQADPIKQKNLEDGRFLLANSHRLGGSEYRLLAEIGIPFTSLKKKIYEQSFESPNGPLFNSASLTGTNENSALPTRVTSKMWTRSFGLEGETCWEDEATTATVCKIQQTSSGNKLYWDAVPYASAYVIRINAPGRNEELHVPGYAGELRLNNLGQYTKYLHNDSSGWEPGVQFTYSVSAVWSRGERRMPVELQ